MGVYSKSTCTLFIGITSAANASYVVWTAALLLFSLLRRASKTYWEREEKDSEYFYFFSASSFLLGPFTLITSISIAKSAVHKPRTLGAKSCWSRKKKKLLP